MRTSLIILLLFLVDTFRTYLIEETGWVTTPVAIILLSGILMAFWQDLKEIIR